MWPESLVDAPLLLAFLRTYLPTVDEPGIMAWQARWGIRRWLKSCPPSNGCYEHAEIGATELLESLGSNTIK